MTNTNHVYLMVECTIQAGRLDELFAAARSFAAEVLTMPGCSPFEFHLSIENASTTIIVLEEWTPQHDFEGYRGSPAITKWPGRTSSFIKPRRRGCNMRVAINLRANCNVNTFEFFDVFH
jgi:quinol monooxygenase YgiN